MISANASLSTLTHVFHSPMDAGLHDDVVSVIPEVVAQLSIPFFASRSISHSDIASVSTPMREKSWDSDRLASRLK